MFRQPTSNNLSADNINIGDSATIGGLLTAEYLQSNKYFNCVNGMCVHFGDIDCTNGDVNIDSGGLNCNFINCYGVIVSGDYQNLSDHRLKENVEPISEEYSIDGLKPCVYEFISDAKKTKHTGFIAHEVQEVLPHLVSGEKNAEEMQSVNYVEIIAILTKEVQNLKAKFTTLEAETAELKAELNELKHK